MDRFESAGLIVEIAQVALHEGDEPDVVTDLLDADLWPAKTWPTLISALVANPPAGR